MRIQIGSIFRESFVKEGRYYIYHGDSGVCQYKRWSLVLSSNGDVIPCPAGIHLCFGNIRERSLEDIWYSIATQSFKALPIDSTECADCDIRQYCGGGCRVNAKRLHGSYLAKDDDACLLYRFFVDKIQSVLEKNGIIPVFLPHMPRYHYNAGAIDTRWA